MPEHEMSDYVSAAEWTRNPGRADHIDEIADQFERPAAHWVSAEEDPVAMWPRAARGWRSADRLSGHRNLERRVG